MFLFSFQVSSMPTLTVFIASYNYAEYLEEAISSVLDQPYEDLELLIIDDGSTDSSPSLIEAYAKKDSRVRPVLYKENRGLMAIANEGISLAKGSYLHFLSADDKRLPTFFVEMMELTVTYPNVSVFVSDFGFFRDKIETWKLIEEETSIRHFPPKEVISACQKTTFWIPGHTSITKKEAILRFGGFDKNLQHLCDWFLLHSIAMNEGVVYLPKTLALMRFHDKTFTKSQRDNRKELKKTYRYLLQKLLQKSNQELCSQFRQSALLTFIFKDLFWKLLLNPRYANFWPYVNVKYSVKGRIMQSLRKKCGKLFRKKII